MTWEGKEGGGGREGRGSSKVRTHATIFAGSALDSVDSGLELANCSAN